MLCFLHLAERLSRWKGTKPYLAGLPLSQVPSGLRLPQPLEQTFPLESTPGGGNVPQDTEAGKGRHCEPCLAKSHGEALGYSDGVAAPGERCTSPTPGKQGSQSCTAWEPIAEEEIGEQNSCISHCREIPTAQESSGSQRQKLSRIRPKARTLAGGWACPATQTPECSPPDLETPGLPYGVSTLPTRSPWGQINCRSALGQGWLSTPWSVVGCNPAYCSTPAPLKRLLKK